MGFYISYQAIYVAATVLISWVLAHLLKPLCNKSVSWKQLFSVDGGMPSAHTAPASALAFSILISNGFTILFIVAFVFLVAVMRDAVGVRFAVGANALALQELAGKKKLKQMVILSQGHRHNEVMMSLFLGIFVALALFLVL